MKTIAPVYLGPWAPEWSTMAADWLQTGRRPDVVVVNPASGIGGPLSESWRRLVELLHTLGCVVVGYVATGIDHHSGDRTRVFSARPIEHVVAEIGEWHAAGVDGIFADEIASSTPFAYAGAIVGAVRRWRPNRPMPYLQNGLPAGLPILNPGAPVPSALIEGSWGAIWVTAEGPAEGPAGITPEPIAPRATKARQAALVHSCAPHEIGTRRRMLSGAGFGWGYVTADRPPNPWDGYTPQ